jgi:hypothetical protein
MLDSDQKRREIIQQIDDEILPEIKKYLIKVVDQLLTVKKSRIPEEYMEKKSYLLLKAAIFCFCKNNPYSPSSERTKQEFKELDL